MINNNNNHRLVASIGFFLFAISLVTLEITSVSADNMRMLLVIGLALLAGSILNSVAGE